MKDIEIKINKETRMVEINKYVLGNDGENLQGNLIFTFDEFVNGQARLEYLISGNKYFVLLEKVNNTYQIPILSVITKKGQIDMQLVVTEGIDEKEIPIFKSNIFYLICNASINAVNEAPDEYEQWIDIANTKLNEIDEALLESEIQSAYAKEQGDYANEQGQFAQKQAENVQSDILNIRNIADEAKENSETAISIAKGANQSLTYQDYNEMITVFNSIDKDKYKVGQNILIVTLNVPDLWISAIEEESTPYTYVDDDTFTNELKTNGIIKVGYYILSALETQKVDLTEYVKNTDYITNSKAGIPRVLSGYGVIVVNPATGLIGIQPATQDDITQKTNKYKPIVPDTLDYAVGSVKASESQSGTAKMWTTENEDGEIGLNISTEV